MSNLPPFPSFAVRERLHISSVLGWELENGNSRDIVVIAGDANAVRDLPIGTVLGRALFGQVTAAAAAANTGKGSVTAVTLGKQAKVGTYMLTCIAAAAGGGRFEVVDPDGLRLADAVVGTAYVSPQLALALAAAAPDFAVGDTLSVTVAEGDGRCVPLAPDATDGTQLADSVLLAPTYADIATDVAAPAVVRLAGLVSSGLVWPADISDADKQAALAHLAQRNLFLRASA